MENQLVELTTETALTVFTVDNGLDPYVQQVKDEVNNFKHDLSTAAGRKRSASLAAKVAKMKVKLDGMGKDLVAEWKSNSKKVDGARKKMRDDLDELKVIARKPLTEWEAEQEKIEADKLAAEEIEKVNVQHEMALLLNNEFDRNAEDARLKLEAEQKIEAERLEKLRVENEARIAEEAAKKAKHEAEQLAQKTINDAKIAEQKAIDDKIKSDKALVEAQQEQVRLAEQAEQTRLNNEWLAYISEAYDINKFIDEQRALKAQAEAAELSRLASIEAERLAGIERQKEEQKKLEAEAAAREANKAHKGKINKGILSVLIANGIPEEYAKKMVILAAKRELPNLTISY